jgi:thiamine transport system substrate-binding protein
MIRHQPSRPRHRFLGARPPAVAAFTALFAVAVTASALGPPATVRAQAGEEGSRPQVTLMTHDSFFLPEELLTEFEERHGAELRLLQAGDAGLMVNQAILTAGAPLADVIFGVDDFFLSRALEADILEPYASPLLEHVPAELLTDPDGRVTPVDVGHVCLNVDDAALDEAGLPRPERLEDLLLPELRGALVVQNPATSSPGLAFLAATVARFGEADGSGEGGWQAFWAGLRENDVAVAAGWEEAYYGRFSGGSGEGERPIVVSYATSPVAEVVFGPDPEAGTAPTSVVTDGCIRQVEYAAVLRGTAVPELARAVVDHLLSPEVQAAIPLSMFVYPVRDDVALPDAFLRHGVAPPEPLRVDPAVVDRERERWIGEWTDIVLR